MQNVSTGFMNAMVASVRSVYPKIEFRQIDVTARTDCTATSTDTESITTPSAMVDAVEGVTTNYATFETDRWRLNGSYKLLPNTAPYNNMGWWSDALSNTTLKTFSPNITNTFQFTTNHSSVGFTIFFDTTNNEWAEEFDIKYYNSSNALIQTINVTGNTNSLYISETGVSNYRKIEVIIKKWNLGDRRARIDEVIFGVVKLYNESSLISLKILEELDVISKNIPSNQLTFSIDNSSRQYDILNPIGIYQYLQQQQEMIVSLGTLVNGALEFVNMGRYYLSEWTTQENKLEAKFIGLDRLHLLQQKTYYKSIYQSATLSSIATNILSDFGLSASDYSLDSALTSITVNSFIPICTYREALQYVAVAGQCILYVDRNNVIQMKRVGTTSSGEEIDFANSYNAPRIELDKFVRQVDVDVHSFTTAGSATEIYKGELNVSGTKTYWIVFNSPASNHTSSVTSGTIDSVTYYTNACYITITAVGSTTLTVNGRVITVNSTPITTTVETDGEVLTVKSQLISTTTIASNVGTWVKGEVQKRNKFICNWRMNPAFELSDLVDVENQFATYPDARIYKQEYNYNGALKGITEARG